MVLSIIALILGSVKPHYIGGRRHAMVGLLASLIGVAWLILLNLSFHAQYGPWGRIPQIEIQMQLKRLAESLDGHCKQNGGRFPESLEALVDHDPEVDWCLHVNCAPGSTPVTDLHFVRGLDTSCPPDWIVAYADSDLFNHEGGAILTVDGAVQLIDEPEFRKAFARFTTSYQVARGKPPEILPPH